MLVIQIVGKQTFFSSKKNQDYFVIHCVFRKDGVNGFAVESKFISGELFQKVDVNKFYAVVYGAYDNGRAFIADLKEVQQNQ